MPRALPVLLAACSLVLAACGGDDEAAERATTEPTPAAQDATGLPDGCKPADAPEPRDDGGAERPSGEVPDGARVRFETNCGAFVIELDTGRAPKTSRSFASLVRQGFYDGTIFHRIVPGFVIQGGDPTGTGTGGPGYAVEEAPPKDLAYEQGVVAMAKTGDEPPGTSGSQFYVVSGDATQLPPDYALVGEVVEGMDVVSRIESVQTTPDERPVAPIVVASAKVEG